MIIAITGRTASGKSTAVNMLRNSGFTVIDKDKITNQLFYGPLKQRIDDFIESKFGVRIDDIQSKKEFIINNIFTSPDLHKEYCTIFEDVLVSMFETNLLPNNTTHSNEIVIYEVSALYAYPRLMKYFDHVIEIELCSDDLRKRNMASRNKEHVEIYNNLYKSIDSAQKVFLLKGTLLELRGSIEKTLIQCIYPTQFTQYFKLLRDLSYSRWTDNPYHNKHHTLTVLTNCIIRLTDNLTVNYTEDEASALFVAAIFHDIGYDPKVQHGQNEENAINIMKGYLDNNIHSSFRSTIDEAEEIIRYTADYTQVPPNAKCRLFAKADLSHFNRTKEEIFEINKLIFEECSIYDFNLYKKASIELLTKISIVHIISAEGIKIAIGWINQFNPKIGWFCGSFDPYTVGHRDVVLNAKEMFDKVVVVRARNPNKPPHSTPLVINESVEVIDCTTNIPSLITEVGYTPTMIRGIRDSADVDDALAWIQQVNSFLDHKVNLCMIPSGLEYRHISSTFVRDAIEGGQDVSHLLGVRPQSTKIPLDCVYLDE